MFGIRDTILTLCSLALGYALIPQVVYGYREKLGTVTVQTGVITAVCLYAIAAVYLSLSLWFAAAACGLSASLWVVLLGQRLYYGRPERTRRGEGS